MSTDDITHRFSVISLSSNDSMYILKLLIRMSDNSPKNDLIPPRLFTQNTDNFPSIYENPDEFRRRCQSVDEFISTVFL